MDDENWKRTPAAVERDEVQSRIYGLYFQARIELTRRELLGVRAKEVKIDGAPDWLLANLDESGLAVLRSELVETFDRYKPAEGWEHPDGEESGAWRRLPQDPEKLVEWTDNFIRTQTAEIAMSVLREIMTPRRTTAREKE